MAAITRRRLVQSGLAAGSALAFPWAWQHAHARPATGLALAKYVQPLPRPGAGIVVASPLSPGSYRFTQRQILRQLHPQLPPTPVWAYDDGSGLAGQAGSFGMALVAHRGVPINVQYLNAIGATYPAWLPVDLRLAPRGSEIRVMTHLHGAFVTSANDGNPAEHPLGYGLGEMQAVNYPNEAPATLLWFHDHGPGTTRLNVVAGLAAAYILRDEWDTGLEPNPMGVPGGAYEVPLVIQDRMFNADGSFLYPRSDIEGSTWIGEYFGDVMLVNGKAWPYLDVEPRLYRLRLLNGCNARILDLSLAGTTFWQIGSDGGLFDVPVPLTRLALAPAERADVIVDFSRFAGQQTVMKNHRVHHPVSNPAPNLEAVMQFRVGTSLTQAGPSSIPPSLPGRRAALPSPVTTRFMTLNEVEPEEQAWTLNINGTRFDEPATETPRAGTVEDWVYVNLTGDTHPLHVHLVQFQVVGRTPFDAEAYVSRYAGPYGVPGGIDPTPYATGPMQAPAPEERGFKDTVKANPGFFTTIRMRFDLPAGASGPQRYVQHCHILEHEDNDMMRPFVVVA